MSESAPERTGGGGNVFTRKIGPLPMWAWMGIALLVAVAYYVIAKKNSTAAAASATTNTPGGVDSSLIPQFVNQVYNQEEPPAAPTVGPAGPPGAKGPPGPPGANGQPATKPPKPTKTTYKQITVQPGQTLQSLAAQYHTTVDAIADSPGNVYVKGEVPGDKKVGQQLGTGAGLKTGMKINIPITTT